MGMLDRISRLIVGGSAGAARDATQALAECYTGCVQRARQLSRHAERAPQDYGATGLHELATAEERQASRVRDALQAAGAVVPGAAAVDIPSHALNHWARLVQDLEAHRLSARRLRELAVHFAETLPSTAALFDELCREENDHCERLRTLIARADPQALD